MIKLVILSIGMVVMGIFSIMSAFMEKPEYLYDDDANI